MHAGTVNQPGNRYGFMRLKRTLNTSKQVLSPRPKTRAKHPPETIKILGVVLGDFWAPELHEWPGTSCNSGFSVVVSCSEPMPDVSESGPVECAKRLE